MVLVASSPFTPLKVRKDKNDAPSRTPDARPRVVRLGVGVFIWSDRETNCFVCAVGRCCWYRGVVVRVGGLCSGGDVILCTGIPCSSRREE